MTAVRPSDRIVEQLRNVGAPRWLVRHFREVERWRLSLLWLAPDANGAEVATHRLQGFERYLGAEARA